MARAVILAGGNLGNVETALATAGQMIRERIGTIDTASGIYASEPWGFESGERFLNQAFVVETPLSPQALLDELEKIEEELGRRKTRGPQPAQREYASRTIDLDILFYDDRIINTPSLTIPHPLLAERRFALEPLCEIIPHHIHPVLGKTVRELLESL